MKKEMTMEARLLLAFVLMGLVLFGTQYFYKPPPQPPAKPVVAKSAEPEKPDNPVSTAPAEKAKPAPAKTAAKKAEMPGQIQSNQEETIAVDTDLYHVEFSNRGAVARSWVLKAYKDRNGKPLELVNQKALERVPPPFSLVFKNQPPATDPNGALFHVDRSADGLNLKFEFSDG